MPHKGQLTTAEKFAAQLLALGKSLTFAAESADLSLPQLRKRLELPLMQQEIERWRFHHFTGLSESLGARLQELQHPALEAMGDLLTAESEPVRKSAATDLLDRGPIGRKMQSGAGQGAQGTGQGQISLDQAALTAILAGAINIGHAGILTAFAALKGQQEHQESHSQHNGTTIDITPIMETAP